MHAHAESKTAGTGIDKRERIIGILKQRFSHDVGDDPSAWAAWAIENDNSLDEIEKSNLKFITRIFEVRKRHEWSC
jgi:hypothetical protein